MGPVKRRAGAKPVEGAKKARGGRSSVGTVGVGHAGVSNKSMPVELQEVVRLRFEGLSGQNPCEWLHRQGRAGGGCSIFA